MTGRLPIVCAAPTGALALVGDDWSQSVGDVALQNMSVDARGEQCPVEQPPAFASAYQAHARSILIFLTRQTYDPETALDLTAETFAQAFAGRRRFRGSTEEEFVAWLFGIARNVHARFLRRERAERRALGRLGVEVPALEPDEVVRIAELAGLDELRGTVARELRGLPEDQREALRLRVIEELPYVVVASRLAISEATARARVSRGLRALGRALNPPSPTQEMSR
jgi:RNA polymerase sigma factor (sigma-70 family)